MLPKLWKSLAIVLTLGVVSGLYFERYTGESRTVSVRIETPRSDTTRVFSGAELSCLAKVVFNESRNQQRVGQLAVAAVVINRSLSAKFKHTDLCKVASRPGQFAFHEPKLTNIIEQRAMVKAMEVAKYVTQNYGSLDPQLREHLYFNSNKAKAYATTIQDHHFYVSAPTVPAPKRSIA